MSFPGLLRAQSNVSGDIAGTVTDSSGAAVAHAQVTVTSASTGQIKTAVSGGNGDYRVSLLSPGSYKISVTAPGFETSDLTAAVSAGIVTTEDVKLTVGQASTTVEVTGSEEPLLHTEDANITTTFTMQQVQSLPNPGNDLTFVAQTSPGAVMNTQGGYGNFSIFGLPATSNTFTINGGYENDPFLNLNNSGATNLLLGNNDVGSVTIVSNAYGAQYGGLGGSQVNEISRSGSNKFHGDATWWWNGDYLNANDYFNNQTGTKRPRSNANQWAGSIGGPIKRDKTFFFFNTEGLRVIIPVRDTVYAPSPSYIAQTLATINPSDTGFYNGLFGVYTQNPKYVTAAADPSDPNAVVFSSNSSNFAHEWIITGRVDQKLTDKDNIYFHARIDKGVQPTFTSVLDPIFNAESPQPQYGGEMNETHVFSPAVANQFVFAIIYYRAIFTNTNQKAANAIAPFTHEWLDGDLSLNGPASYLGGYDFLWPQGRNVTNYQFVDDFSWTKGAHTFKAGMAFRRDDVTDYGPGVLTTPLSLSTEADFAAGIGDAYIQQFPEHYDQPVALFNLGLYAQDEWKALPNLTLTYGLRLENNSNPICHNNCYARLSSDFYTLNNQTTTPYNQLIKANQYKAYQQFQDVGWEPRIGFAFQPFGTDGKTVLRGGFGMFADAFPGQITDSLLNNAPTNLQAFVGGGALNPVAAGSNASLASDTNAAFHSGFGTGGSFASISASNPFFSAFNFLSPPQKLYYPMYEEWNLQIEQQIGKENSVSVNYVGNHGFHEPVNNNSVNAFNAGGLTGFPELPAAPPNPNFAAVTRVYSGASSNYNGIIFSGIRRTKNLTVQANYVYSHALDEISNGGFNGFSGNSINPTNPYNLASNYGNADYDTRHYINGSYVYTIPYYRGPRLLTEGWEVAGTIFHSNGLPFTVTDIVTGNGVGYYNGGNGGALMYARQTTPHIHNSCSGGPHVLNYNTGSGNPCGIATDFPYVPTGTVGPDSATDFGQQARNQISGPHYTDFDFTTTKSFPVPHWEGARLKLGFQFFNIFNHPNFGQPANDINGSDIGLVSKTVNPPTSILGSFLGGDASPRLIQTKLSFTF